MEAESSPDPKINPVTRRKFGPLFKMILWSCSLTIGWLKRRLAQLRVNQMFHFTVKINLACGVAVYESIPAGLQ